MKITISKHEAEALRKHQSLISEVASRQDLLSHFEKAITELTTGYQKMLQTSLVSTAEAQRALSAAILAARNLSIDDFESFNLVQSGDGFAIDLKEKPKGA